MMADSIPAITTAKELVAAETTSSIKASEPTVVASDLPISHLLMTMDATAEVSVLGTATSTQITPR